MKIDFENSKKVEMTTRPKHYSVTHGMAAKKCNIFFSGTSSSGSKNIKRKVHKIERTVFELICGTSY